MCCSDAELPLQPAACSWKSTEMLKILFHLHVWYLWCHEWWRSVWEWPLHTTTLLNCAPSVGHQQAVHGHRQRRGVWGCRERGLRDGVRPGRVWLSPVPVPVQTGQPHCGASCCVAVCYEGRSEWFKANKPKYKRRVSFLPLKMMRCVHATTTIFAILFVDVNEWVNCSLPRDLIGVFFAHFP